MLRDYAVSLTCLTLVLCGYTALMLSKKPAPQAATTSALRTEASVKSSLPTEGLAGTSQPALDKN